MNNFNGWNLSARLLVKHLGVLGESVASLIAGFDPETATAADRDALAAKTREIATRFAKARMDFNKEHEDVTSLQAQIARDENIAESLVHRLAAGTIDEATANLFCDELEAARNRLPQEVQEAADAQAFMDELQSILDEMSDRLKKFDAVAAKARREVAQASAQLELQQARQEQQNDLRGLRGEAGGSSSALGALEKRAASLRAQAEGMKVITDIGNKPADDRAKLDALRRSVEQGSSGTPSAMDRLRALSAAKAAA